MPLPYQPEPVAQLRGRLGAALVQRRRRRLVKFGLHDDPQEVRENVFDFPNGMRLTVWHDADEDCVKVYPQIAGPAGAPVRALFVGLNDDEAVALLHRLILDRTVPGDAGEGLFWRIWPEPDDPGVEVQLVQEPP